MSSETDIEYEHVGNANYAITFDDDAVSLLLPMSDGRILILKLEPSIAAEMGSELIGTAYIATHTLLSKT